MAHVRHVVQQEQPPLPDAGAVRPFHGSEVHLALDDPRAKLLDRDREGRAEQHAIEGAVRHHEDPRVRAGIEEVDAILGECQRFAEKDDRMRLKVYDDLVGPTVTVHAFYVKYLLPIWFDVQCMEQKGVAQPAWPARG